MLLSKNSQRWYFAWENLYWDFCDVGCCFSFLFVLHFVVVLHSFTGYFTMPPAIYPGISGLWRPPPALSSTLATFDCLLLFHLLRTLRFWVGIFYSQVFCLPYASSTTFLAFIKAFLGADSSSLKFSGTHADPRNRELAHLFVWFTAIHHDHIQKNLFYNSTKYYHELLVVKV